eukprot:TRINITY_DN68688_c0_g1_i1.p1 TRINITY_DN68688_c0_g1~~TRINITY_DN68688_c0_g1_i1.p1  ORF type:complete len:236 (+),score=23.70 TRINITY_DN68688_c0_g1_i1:51-758(+)
MRMLDMRLLRTRANFAQSTFSATHPASRCLSPSSERCIRTLRYKRSRAATKWHIVADAERLVHLAQKRYDHIADRAAHSKFIHMMEESLGREISAKALGRAGIIIGISVVLGASMMIALMKPYVARRTAGITTEVSASTLQDERLVAEVREIFRSLLKHVDTDAETRKHAVRLVEQILQEPSVKEAVADVVAETLSAERSSDAIASLLRRPQIQSGLGDCIRGTLRHTLWPWGSR